MVVPGLGLLEGHARSTNSDRGRVRPCLQELLKTVPLARWRHHQEVVKKQLGGGHRLPGHRLFVLGPSPEGVYTLNSLPNM
eukprot:711914-Prorocentrum_minimum.AAC.5